MNFLNRTVYFWDENKQFAKGRVIALTDDDSVLLKMSVKKNETDSKLSRFSNFREPGRKTLKHQRNLKVIFIRQIILGVTIELTPIAQELRADENAKAEDGTNEKRLKKLLIIYVFLMSIFQIEFWWNFLNVC